MTANVGNADRAMRAVVGLVLLVLPFATAIAAPSSGLGILLIVVGLVLLGTAALRFCPLYRLLGVRTCKVA